MTTIDIENAKQIRQPMDVIIQIAATETATLTYSGYSAAKVADGELDEPDWPMRKLADLQGDGFLLDGSAVLYDSTVTASAENGKLGVRSVIGTAISVTVTSDVALQYLTVTASGAELVTYNGTAYSMTSGYALIPVGGGTTFTLTFTPAAADERIEISDIQPGALIRITNDNLISAVVSLRSDLSILEPTLPESEINIEAYFDTDISDILASIPDETPVTYQAGYDGDMSPVRKFYLAEQITWADNVMSIHAVDAVHLLDVDTGSALVAENKYITCFAGVAWAFINKYVGAYFNIPSPSGGSARGKLIVDGGITARDYIATVNNLLHQSDDIWYTYVDAGIPDFKFVKPSSSFHINEDDCADCQNDTERVLSSIRVLHRKLILNDSTVSGAALGTANVIKGVGASMSFDFDFVRSCAIGLLRGTEDFNKYIGTSNYQLYCGVLPQIPMLKEGGADFICWDVSLVGLRREGASIGLSGMDRLLGNNLSQGNFEPIPGTWSTEHPTYAQFIPWNAVYDPDDEYWNGNPAGVNIRSQLIAWNRLINRGVIDSSATEYSFYIGGRAYREDSEYITFSSGRSGVEAVIDSPPWLGDITMESTGAKVYPDGAYNSLLQRSNITGSFTWKGDPRMQPRDVFTFHRLDGTDEVCTLENITITHEKGGTSAEITYRKGVC